MLAHAAVWTVGGIVLFVSASVLRSVTGHTDLALLLGLVAAVGWQLSPLKQHCLNRHCAHPPIASFGAAADRDALRFGGAHAAWCLGSCWALMLVPLLVPAWHVGVMLVVSVWMWVEPLDRPERPTWRVRLPLRFLRIAGITVRSLPPRAVQPRVDELARPGRAQVATEAPGAALSARSRSSWTIRSGSCAV